MAYQGLGSLLKPDSDNEELKKKAAKAKASNKSIAGKVVGIPAAAATAYFTAGNPTATMAAYQAGKGIGEGGAELVSGDGVSSGSVNQLVSGAAGGIAAGSKISAASKAAKKSKELSDMLKFLQA